MTVFGFLNINKPPGRTSHDVVAAVRRGLHEKKVGHAGTLDPLATGVLVLCLGRATRLSEYVMHTRKRYEADVMLGTTTTTYDAEGEIIAQRDASHITREQVDQALTAFRGDIEQVPPMYSAIKQGGRKLYDLARAGETVEREARRVTIEQLTLTDWQPPRCTLDVVCSSGTYIRSLAYDLGAALGVGAHLSRLVRRASGVLTVDTAVALDALLTDPDWPRHILPPRDVLAHLPVIELDAAAVLEIQHGRTLTDSAASGVAQAYGPGGVFVAILQGDSGLWRPHKVFLPQS